MQHIKETGNPEGKLILDCYLLDTSKPLQHSKVLVLLPYKWYTDEAGNFPSLDSTDAGFFIPILLAKATLEVVSEMDLLFAAIHGCRTIYLFRGEYPMLLSHFLDGNRPLYLSPPGLPQAGHDISLIALALPRRALAFLAFTAFHKCVRLNYLYH